MRLTALVLIDVLSIAVGVLLGVSVLVLPSVTSLRLEAIVIVPPLMDILPQIELTALPMPAPPPLAVF